MHLQQAQHPGFVAAHLAIKADNVGEHNGSKPSLFRAYHAVGVVIHGRFVRPAVHSDANLNNTASYTLPYTAFSKAVYTSIALWSANGRICIMSVAAIRLVGSNQ